MNSVSLSEEYLRASKLGQKEKKELEALGRPPCPTVLDEQFPQTVHMTAEELPVQNIPADRIIGVKFAGRISAFSASFLPLPEINSEFAAKWMRLLEAHLSDVGIREPIVCYEYLGNFYVLEGNKRVSVLKYYGAVSIPARVLRIMPTDRSDPRTAAYCEFVEFQKSTGLWDIQFKKPGEYARLYSALGKKPGEEWTAGEKQHFAAVCRMFREAFAALGGVKQELSAEEALLLFLKVYPYEQLSGMTQAELKKTLSTLWGDVKASSEPDAIDVKTAPEDAEKKGVISKLISAAPRHLNAAFIFQRNAETSDWTRGHAEGVTYLSSVLGDAVTVRCYYNADTPQEAERLLDEAALSGADLIFTTTPLLLVSTLKAAVKYPKIRFFSCSACQPLSSVTSYYCRIYEGKFITGLIAGALADNDLVGYVGSYPILGVPASINAFALGVRMTNPRAKILLEWSSVEDDCVEKLRERGVRVISNRDIPLPDASYMKGGAFGTFITDGGALRPLASPCWMWGRLYEKIVRSVLSNTVEKKEQAVNYWWGMDSGVIDVALSELVPEGVKSLAAVFTEKLRNGSYDIFGQKLLAGDGSVISDGKTPLTMMEILKMDRLAETVEGHIPEYEEILPRSRALVREVGVHRETIPPETGE